jgi:hypothetical protein
MLRPTTGRRRPRGRGACRRRAAAALPGRRRPPRAHRLGAPTHRAATRPRAPAAGSAAARARRRRRNYRGGRSVPRTRTWPRPPRVERTRFGNRGLPPHRCRRATGLSFRSRPRPVVRRRPGAARGRREAGQSFRAPLPCQQVDGPQRTRSHLLRRRTSAQVIAAILVEVMSVPRSPPVIAQSVDAHSQTATCGRETPSSSSSAVTCSQPARKPESRSRDFSFAQTACQIQADARIRTGDPFITSVDQVSAEDAPRRAKPHRSKGSRRARWRPKTRNGKDVDPA